MKMVPMAASVPLGMLCDGRFRSPLMLAPAIMPEGKGKAQHYSQRDRKKKKEKRQNEGSTKKRNKKKKAREEKKKKKKTTYPRRTARRGRRAP
jgi:hypothetical protein